MHFLRRISKADDVFVPAGLCPSWLVHACLSPPCIKRPFSIWRAHDGWLTSSLKWNLVCNAFIWLVFEAEFDQQGLHCLTHLTWDSSEKVDSPLCCRSSRLWDRILILSHIVLIILNPTFFEFYTRTCNKYEKNNMQCSPNLSVNLLTYTGIGDINSCTTRLKEVPVWRRRDPSVASW